MQQSQVQLSYHSLPREVLAQSSMCKERSWMAPNSLDSSNASTLVVDWGRMHQALLTSVRLV